MALVAGGMWGHLLVLDDNIIYPYLLKEKKE
jgi:hypothetical protein